MRRRLKIGYVSSDFRDHSVMRFFQSVVTSHDRDRVEVICYSNVRRPDQTTHRIRDHADMWRDIVGVGDEQAKEIVVKDRIDILVDLVGHTGDHRLLLFGRRPAPVQVTYLGYPNTTGLSTIDYRITDGDADPVGMTESHHTETLIRLPDSFLCYSPPFDIPQRPLHRGRETTFGSFNNLAKITSEMLELWGRIVCSVPNSKLVIKSVGLSCARVRERFYRNLADRGVHPSRVALLPYDPSSREHLLTYHKIDIALDTFPYHGTTTTCEALWMGVPVVSLAGHAHVSRVGVSLLRRAGLTPLIATTMDEYFERAVALAGDHEQWKAFSSNIRERLRLSPLANPSRFVQDLEDAFALMWFRWCEGLGARSLTRFA